MPVFPRSCVSAREEVSLFVIMASIHRLALCQDDTVSARALPCADIRKIPSFRVSADAKINISCQCFSSQLGGPRDLAYRAFEV